MSSESPRSIDGGCGQTTGPPQSDVEEFQVTVAQLKNKLKEKEEHHRIAMQVREKLETLAIGCDKSRYEMNVVLYSGSF